MPLYSVKELLHSGIVESSGAKGRLTRGDDKRLNQT